MKSSIGGKRQPDESLDGKKIHPLAKRFPPMPKEEFNALADDIKENGLTDPIVLLDDKILDGVNRLRASLKTGVKPKYKTWDGEGGTPEEYVFSKNMSRRHLSTGQKAVIALLWEAELSKEAKKRMSHKACTSKGVAIFPHLEGEGRARDEAGRKAGVSGRYVSCAKKLQKERPNLFRKVWTGELNISAAMQMTKEETKESRKATHKAWIIFQEHKLTCVDLPGDKAEELAKGFVEKGIIVRIKDKRKKERPRMYADTKTWNPFRGCGFACIYCTPSFQKQAKRLQHKCHKCYKYTPHEHPERLHKIPDGETIFVCGNSDISFCTPEYFRSIIDSIKEKNEINKRKKKPEQTFYIQSKRPEYFKPYLKMLPPNVVLVTTLETNRDAGYGAIAQAPLPSKRFKQFLDLKYPRKIITAEPLLDFDVQEFAGWITKIKPERVWLGYNSRECQVSLPEPAHKKVMELSAVLLKRGIDVIGKDLRGLEMPEGVKRSQD